MSTRAQIFRTGLLVIAGLLAMTASVAAATCNVPSGTHPDIQTAVDDIGCTPILVAAGTFPAAVVISRTLTLTGAGSDQSIILGGVEVQAGTVNITGFHISGPGEALLSHSGAEVSGFDLQIVSGGTVEPPLFADGFEDGTTDGWSAVSP